MNMGFVRSITVLAILLFASVIARSYILGGSKVIALEPAQSLVGVISQGLGSSDTTSLPQPEKDFHIESERYFDNKAWVVVSIAPRGNNSINGATLVLHQSDDVYQIVLGPGTAFSSSSLNVVPADVGQYLNNQGYIYEPSE